MAFSFSTINARVITTTLANTSTENPTTSTFGTTFNRDHVYCAQSIATNTWGMLLALPATVTVTQRCVYWYDNTLSKDKELLKRIIGASLNSHLRTIYQTDGVPYIPASSGFTAVAELGYIYIHFMKLTDTTFNVKITDSTGNTWSSTTSSFSVPGATASATLTMGPYVPSASTNLPNSAIATANLWTPPMTDATILDTTASNSSRTLGLVVVPTAASINAQLVGPDPHAYPVRLDLKVYLTTDTHELIFPLFMSKILNYSPDFNSIHYLPNFIGTNAPSIGEEAPVMVKLTPKTPEDIALFTGLSAYSTVEMSLNNNQLASFANAVVTPLIVIDLTVLNYYGFLSDPATNSTYYGVPAYLFVPTVLYRPAAALKMTKLTHTYRGSALPFLSSVPSIEQTHVYRSGNTLPSQIVAGNYVFPVKSQNGWSALQKGFNFTGATGTPAFRITFKPSSPIAPDILQQANRAMSFKIGVYGCAPPSLRTQYRVPSYALDLRPDEPEPFYYLELSSVRNSIAVTAHIPSASTTPFLGSTTIRSNDSGQIIDWTGSTQVDLCVEKNTSLIATLTLYLNRKPAATFTVPWIEIGHIVYLATTSVAYSGSPPLFTLTDPVEVMGEVGPYLGLIAPPPPTLNEYRQLTSTRVTTAQIDTNPYCVYYHDKGTSADLYLPLLAEPDVYRPTQFAVIRNFPYTSGTVWDKIVNQVWSSGRQLHSYIIDTLDSAQFPSTASLTGIGILYAHNPPEGPTFSVTLYTGSNWATLVGTYTAEIISTLITYKDNPYPKLTMDSLSTPSAAYAMQASRSTTSMNNVTLTGSASSGTGTALAMAFSSVSSTAWSFSFTRSSIGLYLEGGYFDIIITGAKKEHQFLVNPSSGDLNLVPFPHLPSVRVRFTQDSEVYPTVQLSKAGAFSYAPALALNTGAQFHPYDGTHTITLALEKVGGNSILHLYEGTKFIANIPLAMPFQRSGNIVVAHGNATTSVENISYMKLTSGKQWLLLAEERPLLLTPVVNRSTHHIVTSEVSVFQLEDDTKYAYADVYIRNPNTTAIIVSVTLGGTDRVLLLSNKSIPPNGTYVLSSKYVAPGEHIHVTGSNRTIVRVAAVCELK